MRLRLCGLTILCALALAGAAAAKEPAVTKYCRFQAGKKIAYGIVEGDTVHELTGTPFGKYKKSGKTHKLAEVKLLVPCEPKQVLALAGNWKSHISGTPVPEKFKIPQPFYKSFSSLTATGTNIVIPPGTKEVHYEAELVIVIGKKAKDVPESEALKYVLGVTCGNDVSARDWQKGDIQWWRAKGSDTFGPVGPVIAGGLNYDNLQLRLRLNDKVVQDENTKNFIQNVPKVVSFVSKYVTLHPGDLIFTGTPGKTAAIKPGDIVEVELEGVGVLRNKVVAAKGTGAKKSGAKKSGAKKPATFAGAWKLHIETPDGQVLEPVMQFTGAGKKIKGSVTEAGGKKNFLEGVQVKEGKLLFTYKGEYNGAPITVKYQATAEGDTMKGILEYDRNGETGELKFIGKRVKKEKK